jgi:5-hydroxyisourate hydrolase
MTISTHVLDTSIGRPAAGVRVQLAALGASGTWERVFDGETDADGRIPRLVPPGSASAGKYRLWFDVAAYFGRRGTDTFYGTVMVEFIAHAEGHHHVPLLISPFGYSTYRGS